MPPGAAGRGRTENRWQTCRSRAEGPQWWPRAEAVSTRGCGVTNDVICPFRLLIWAGCDPAGRAARVYRGSPVAASGSPSAEGEREDPGAGVEVGDLDRVLADRPGPADQLV